jgi:hypothetical protein
MNSQPMFTLGDAKRMFVDITAMHATETVPTKQRTLQRRLDALRGTQAKLLAGRLDDALPSKCINTKKIKI